MLSEVTYTSYDTDTGEIIHVPPFEECLQVIQRRYKDMKGTAKRLEEENKALKDEQYKNKELQSMKEQLESMQRAIYRGFPISEEEQEKIRKWQKEHDRKVHNVTDIEGYLNKAGTIGGDYTYEFTPTTIGTFGSIKCTCGARFDFQEEA